MNLKGKSVVVTGSASGIGLATARALAAAGASVVAADISVDAGKAVAEDLKSQGLDARFEELDVTSMEAVTDFSTRVLAAGQVDILVNVAGYGKAQNFLQNEPEFWDRVVEVNFLGPVRLAHRFIPAMVARRSGRIVNVASDAGRVGSSGEAVYSGAKGGLIAFTKGLARETARHNVCVNCVCPGPTETPMLTALPDRHREALLNAIPMRRFAKADDIADAILFLSSEQAGYITGQTLSVSGGLTMS
jgi:2-hydroxycyclohexanecarboxyl-CoA dehydrogenase